MNFRIFKNLEPELEVLWKTFEKESNHFFFQNFLFVKKIIALQKRNYYFFVVYNNEKIIAILPLEIKKIFGIKILQWIGTKYADYCGPLLSKQHKINSVSFQGLWKKMLEKIDYDVIILDKQTKYIDNLENPFVNFLNNSEVSKIFLIDLPNKEDEYFKNILNKKFYNEFKRTSNKINEKYDLKFENVEIHKDTFKPSDLIIKKKLILDKKFSRETIDKNFINFFDDLIFDYPEQIKLSVLKINKEIVSANLGFVKNDRFYYYMPTLFKNNYNKYSPGKILISELIKWSIQNKLKIFDFGLGEENYKKYWSNSTESLFRYLYGETIKGLIIIKFIKIYLFIKNCL